MKTYFNKHWKQINILSMVVMLAFCVSNLIVRQYAEALICVTLLIFSVIVFDKLLKIPEK